MKTKYELNTAKLERGYTDCLGHGPSKESVRFFQAMIPYVEMAYEAGQNHTELCETLPFLRKAGAAQ